MNMSTQRIQYVDAMRGLAMVMVVISHIFVLCLNYVPIYNELISIQFQIPLFFFISGFFAKKWGGV